MDGSARHMQVPAARITLPLDYIIHTCQGLGAGIQATTEAPVRLNTVTCKGQIKHQTIFRRPRGLSSHAPRSDCDRWNLTKLWRIICSNREPTVGPRSVSAVSLSSRLSGTGMDHG